MKKKIWKISGLLLVMVVCMVLFGGEPVGVWASSDRLSFSTTTYKKNVNSKEFQIRVSANNVGKITWTSSNKKVATVDRDGNVTIVGSGKAKIKAVAKGKTTKKKLTATADIIVAKPSLSCSKRILTIKKGSCLKYYSLLSVANLDSDYTIDWTSEDENIVQVCSLGGKKLQITTLDYGSTIITGTIKGVGSVQIEIEVPSPEIICGNTTVEIEKTKTKTISMSIKNIPSNDYIEWESSNESVIVVMSAGTSNRTVKLTAVDYGEATITGRIGNDENGATIEIYAYVLSPTVTVAKPYYNVRVNKSVSFSATTKHLPSTDYLTWSIADPTVARVTTSGTSDKKVTIVGLNPGETLLTVKAPDGDTCEISIYVTE